MFRKAFGSAPPLCAGVLLLAVSGCQVFSPVPEVRETERIEGVTGESVEFHADALPLDATSELLGTSLGITDAVHLAVQNDAELQVTLAEVRAAKADALQTRLLPNPILSIAVRFPSSGASIIEASVSEELRTLLTRPSSMSAADARLRVAAAQSLAKALDVVAEVQERYVAAQSSERLMSLLQERRAVVSRLLSVSEARLDAGEGTRPDVLAVQVKRSEVEVELAEARRTARRERLAVARLIGRPSDAAEWALTAPVETTSALGNESEWMMLAAERRPELAAISWELTALGFDKKRVGLAPFDTLQVGVDSERDGPWSVGPAASVPLPLFDWGQATRASADARVQAAGHKLTALQRQVVQEVRQAFSDYREARAVLDRVRSELLSVAQRRRDQAEDAYKAGQSDLVDVLLADEELQSAKAKEVRLSRELFEARVRLERAAGGVVRDHEGTSPASTEATETKHNIGEKP